MYELHEMLAQCMSTGCKEVVTTSLTVQNAKKGFTDQVSCIETDALERTSSRYT